MAWRKHNPEKRFSEWADMKAKELGIDKKDFTEKILEEITYKNRMSNFRFWTWLGGVVWTYNSGFGVVKAIFWPMWFGAKLAEFGLSNQLFP